MTRIALALSFALALTAASFGAHATTAAAQAPTLHVDASLVSPLRAALLVNLPLDLEQSHLATAPVADTHPTTLFGLPQNVGTLDRVIRLVAGAALLSVGIWGVASHQLDDVASGVLMGVSAIPLLTGAVGYCPIYGLFGWDTNF